MICLIEYFFAAAISPPTIPINVLNHHTEYGPVFGGPDTPPPAASGPMTQSAVPRPAKSVRAPSGFPTPSSTGGFLGLLPPCLSFHNGLPGYPLSPVLPPTPVGLENRLIGVPTKVFPPPHGGLPGRDQDGCEDQKQDQQQGHKQQSHWRVIQTCKVAAEGQSVWGASAGSVWRMVTASTTPTSRQRARGHP